MRFMVLAAQGVWFNSLFFAYLISPRTVHRFVGYLEEEAVVTYTRQIADLDAGKLPQWQKMEAPQIAIDYWRMPDGHRKMRDLLLYIRCVRRRATWPLLMACPVPTKASTARSTIRLATWIKLTIRTRTSASTSRRRTKSRTRPRACTTQFVPPLSAASKLTPNSGPLAGNAMR